MIKVSTTGMAVSLKTDLRFPISGQWGHGDRIIHYCTANSHNHLTPMCQYMLLPKVLAKSKHFEPTAHVQDLAEYASPIVSCGNQTGEGWFLTGEMLELINEGVTNIICAQPFACLPNHIVGKGVIKKIRHDHPDANIVAIDYDPGASEVNQLNRIKLMLSTAQKKLKK